jgi:cysteine synthase
MNKNDKKLIRDGAIRRCRERKILIPTFSQQQNPEQIDSLIVEKLKKIGLQDLNPLNLFRITWKNNHLTNGFGQVNHLEIPSEISGVSCRIIGLVGKHFPTGAHKVGAAFGCLVPRLIRGEFDPGSQKAVWPSTGNYCRGGAFDSVLLGCDSVAILPEEMSRERFEWLKEVNAEIIATPGCESNVKEIFDACWDIRKNRQDAIIFNQFEEFGNYLWHRSITGPAVEEVFSGLDKGTNFAGWIGATGSGGTLAAGDFLKKRFPGSTITAAEALQCPTLLQAGFGGHRIEGIGDKHIPWIHNARNTDMVCAIDDEDTMRLLRLFNEGTGKEYLQSLGLDEDLINSLSLLGISSICNLLAAIKTAKYLELGENDVLFTSFTDSAEMYYTRVDEQREDLGEYSAGEARVDHERRMLGAATDHFKELLYTDRKAIHNLKYFTWVEQQGKSVEDLNALWSPSFWEDVAGQVPELDRDIEEFNQATGALDLIKAL